MKHAAIHSLAVASESDPKRRYMLTLRDDGGVECSCPSFRFGTVGKLLPQCKHVRAFVRATFLLAVEGHQARDERGRFRMRGS